MSPAGIAWQTPERMIVATVFVIALTAAHRRGIA